MKNTPFGLLTAAFGPSSPAPSLIRLTAKVSGGPIKFMEYNDVSVQIRTSCLAFNPPTIDEPEDKRSDPAVFVLNGSNSKAFS